MAIFKKDIFLVSHIRANCKAHVNTNGLFSSHKIAIFGMYLTPPVKGFVQQICQKWSMTIFQIGSASNQMTTTIFYQSN